MNSPRCLYTCTLALPEPFNVGFFSTCPSSFSVKLLLILQSPAWCHPLCEALSGCQSIPLCPLSLCLRHPRLSLHSQTVALGMVALSVLSAPPGQGPLAHWIEEHCKQEQHRDRRLRQVLWNRGSQHGWSRKSRPDRARKGAGDHISWALCAMLNREGFAFGMGDRGRGAVRVS